MGGCRPLGLLAKLQTPREQGPPILRSETGSRDPSSPPAVALHPNGAPGLLLKPEHPLPLGFLVQSSRVVVVRTGFIVLPLPLSLPLPHPLSQHHRQLSTPPSNLAILARPLTPSPPPPPPPDPLDLVLRTVRPLLPAPLETTYSLVATAASKYYHRHFQYPSPTALCTNHSVTSQPPPALPPKPQSLARPTGYGGSAPRSRVVRNTPLCGHVRTSHLLSGDHGLPDFHQGEAALLLPLDTESHTSKVPPPAALQVSILAIARVAPGPMMKTGAASLLMLALLMPITRQFFLPVLPVLTWLVFFFNARFIPAEYRPHIWVKVLPALENIFYGANLSNILAAHQYVTLDILAWLPYGILHYGGPVVWAILMFLFGPPGTLPVYARSFGYLSITGVMIQLLFPCSAPWYENLYGLAAANYSIEGSAAGLSRIDKLFGIDLYTSNFKASPLVFGAFPSLHSGMTVLEALFMSHCFPKLRPLLIGYTMWMWWATMYLSHHYAVDLVGGAFIAAITFYMAKSSFLPRIQMDKTFRWDYDYVEVGDAPSVGDYEYGLTVLDTDFHTGSSDEWTAGSSSSFSSGSRSPIDDGQSWEGETLASQVSDSELNEVIVR
ncbi:uncharacterized protein BP5553_08260 [Venustampulla echinocandica]|uniref:Phosphatidic acid phosphatase type 2/haloperoxidase domain-containing protein n=1 Tax=Venustampulla echinocandica TaxID=2656787 RepID=A0A370TG72_9HELO|nr:uncharacterized protein BP5553_08260 [Venustampulla echinocandica]RDL33892.1 hypothetical protein BP5553_08260 [Venustampulla echinocandica]